MDVRRTDLLIFLLAAACLIGVTLTPDRADARPSLDVPDLEMPRVLEGRVVDGAAYNQDTTNGEGEPEITGVGANRQKMLIRLGLGLGAQTGLGSGAGRVDINLIGVFEMDNLRFFGQGGYLFGSEAGRPSANDIDLYSTGWFLGAGAGYKVTLVGPDIAGLYAQGGAFFQSVFKCDTFNATSNTCGNLEEKKTGGVGFDVELGGFLHNGNSQVHLGAAGSFSSVLGLTLGATLRWEYRLVGFAK
jgi:hypothetical protein